MIVLGRKESDTTERLHFQFSLSCTGEGNGNPLQCSCLENPRDGGAWWAAIYGVAQSWTQLKRLSSSFRWTVKGLSHTYACILSPLLFHMRCFVLLGGQWPEKVLRWPHRPPALGTLAQSSARLKLLPWLHAFTVSSYLNWPRIAFSWSGRSFPIHGGGRHRSSCLWLV